MKSPRIHLLPILFAVCCSIPTGRADEPDSLRAYFLGNSLTCGLSPDRLAKLCEATGTKLVYSTQLGAGPKKSVPSRDYVDQLYDAVRADHPDLTDAICAPGFEARKDYFFGLDFTPDLITPENIKLSMPYALIQLEKTDGDHEKAVDFIVESMNPERIRAQTNERDHAACVFVMTSLCRALIAFPDKFSAGDRERIGSYVRLQDDYTGGGTENHRLMRWSSGYLYAQWFGGEWGDDRGAHTLTAEELMAETKALLMDEIRFRFANGGMSEYLSPNYLAHHLIPLFNLIESCEDPELRNAALSLADLHITHLALNVHDGYILEPHSRSGGNQFTGSRVRTANGSQYLSWVYWDTFQPGPERLMHPGEQNPIAQPFLSGFRPLPELLPIARGDLTPFTTRSASMGWPHTSEVRYPHTTLRSVYRAPRFAIGAGYQKHLPAGFYLQHSIFGITWTSQNEAAFLQCGHNYWFSDKGPAAMWKAPVSPFQQIAHHENTAVVAFNIPGRDPWPDAGRHDWIPNREKHADKLIDYAAIRFPKAIRRRDWQGQLDDGGSLLCLDDNGVYIGIRTLTPATQPRSLNEHFDYIQSQPRRNGLRTQSAFVFHLATDEDYESLQAFRDAVAAMPVEADWGSGDQPAPVWEVTDPDGDQIRLAYNNRLNPDEQGVVHNLPEVTVNGQLLDFENWPDMEGPGVKLEGGVLHVGDRIIQP